MLKYSAEADTFKEVLHVTKTEHFSVLNSTVADALTDRENDAAFVYTDILAKQEIPVLIGVGMFDMKDGTR